MKVYVAAPFAAREFALDVAEQIIADGHEVTSSWVRSTREVTSETVGVSVESEFEDAYRHALGDLEDVSQADCLVQITSNGVLYHGVDVPPEWLHTGGRHVEVGYALALDKHILLLGDPENIFTRTLASIHQTVPELLSFMKEIEKGL